MKLKINKKNGPEQSTLRVEPILCAPSTSKITEGAKKAAFLHFVKKLAEHASQARDELFEYLSSLEESEQLRHLKTMSWDEMLLRGIKAGKITDFRTLD